MIAWTCEPDRGSEPGVGWEFARGLARLASMDEETTAHLITREDLADQITSALDGLGLGQYLDVVPVRIPSAIMKATRRNRRWAYLYWMPRAVSRTKKIISLTSESSNIVHHVTFATDSIPTFEWRLAGRADIVFGPAGSSDTADRVGTVASWRKSILSSFRNRMRHRNLRYVASPIAQNEHVIKAWAQLGIDAILEPAIFVEPSVQQHILEVTARESNRIVFVGLLSPRKRVENILRALELLPEDYQLLVVGDGSERRNLQILCESLGLGHRVEFTGKVPREEALQHIAGAQVLVNSSEREGAPWVVGEAQALGTVPVVVAGNGADTLVRMAGGVISPSASATDLAAAIQEARNSSLPPSSRWSTDRLPQLLDSWYRHSATENDPEDRRRAFVTGGDVHST